MVPEIIVSSETDSPCYSRSGCMQAAGNHYIGTSGWHYMHWRDAFYPHDLPVKDYLSYYTGKFGTVEINNTFYHLPKAETFAQWRNDAPVNFIFAVKGNRYITHMKKLKEPGQALTHMFAAVKSLESMLGPLLFQLPPHWKKNTGRLEEFLEQLPNGHRYAFEFRDEDWFADDVYQALSKKDAAFCIYELNYRLSPMAVTAGFVYIRLHGPGASYQGDYDDGTLGTWAEQIKGWMAAGKDVYCYFDNDQNGYAVRNAYTLKRMLETET